ncbi:MAG: hypothetical protein ABFC24_06945 [Methanoregulaceae archaeon]
MPEQKVRLLQRPASWNNFNIPRDDGDETKSPVQRMQGKVTLKNPDLRMSDIFKPSRE